jgi:predicted MFS family arabinose efflux permease
LTRIRTKEPARPAQPANPPSLQQEIADGIRFIVRDPYLRTLTLCGGVNNLAGNMLQAVLVIFLVRSVELGPGAAGFLLGIVGCGGVLGASLSSTIARRFGTARALLLGEVCTTPFCFLLPLTTNGQGLVFFVVGGIVLTTGIVSGNIITAGFRQSYVPAGILGRVTATGRLVIFGGIPLGTMLGGILGEAAGPRETIWIAMIGTALSVLILVASPLRHLRDFPASPGKAGPHRPLSS